MSARGCPGAGEVLPRDVGSWKGGGQDVGGAAWGLSPSLRVVLPGHLRFSLASGPSAEQQTLLNALRSEGLGSCVRLLRRLRGPASFGDCVPGGPS